MNAWSAAETGRTAALVLWPVFKKARRLSMATPWISLREKCNCQRGYWATRCGALAAEVFPGDGIAPILLRPVTQGRPSIRQVRRMGAAWKNPGWFGAAHAGTRMATGD
ncbi:MAG: hypothetical protein ACYCOX_07500 [Acidobacteriaceae bacterium]